MGFTVLESQANFVFARCDAMPGAAMYAALRRRGVLVRHFDTPALTDWLRITIGTQDQMAALLDTIAAILKEECPHANC